MDKENMLNYSCPLEVKGSGIWNLRPNILQASTMHRYKPTNGEYTIDIRFAPGGNLVGSAIEAHEGDASRLVGEISDVFGKWDNKTVEFTRKPRSDDYEESYKGIWSEDFKTIEGITKIDREEEKFVMTWESDMRLFTRHLEVSIWKKHSFCLNMARYSKKSPDKMFYDFHIVSNHGEEIEAHKFILCSQSEYFAALFRRENSNKVQLDYPASTIRSCINFLYTIEIELTIDNVEDILALSNYINLKDIEDKASSFMIQNMDDSNVSGILMLSDALEITLLKEAAIVFVAKNFTKFFKDNDNFLLFPKNLFKQIIESWYLILYTDRGTVITGVEREYGILSFIKTYLDVHKIQEEILSFLPYLRLTLTDSVMDKLFSLLSTDNNLNLRLKDSKSAPIFEVISTEPRCFSLQHFSNNGRRNWGAAPEHTFIEKKPFAAHGNGGKFIDSLVVTEKEWDDTILVGGLKIEWSDGTCDEIGTQEGGNQVKLSVPDGEHVISVVGNAGWYVDSLGLVTSTGKVLGPAGGVGGDTKNALVSLGTRCEITKTFLDGISGYIVRTNTNLDTWTVAKLQFQFITATDKIHEDIMNEIHESDDSEGDDTDAWDEEAVMIIH